MTQIKYSFYVQQVDGGFAIFQIAWRGDEKLSKRQLPTTYTTAKAADRRHISICGQARTNGELKNA